MARIFLVRHGMPATTWGGPGSDPGLSEVGREQAAAAAVILAGLGSVCVVTSPMRRCRETAAPFAARRRTDPTIEPRVSEIVAPDEVEDRAAWLQERFPWRDPEKRRDWATLEPTLHDWRRQMLGFLHTIEADTVVFTHFVAINVMAGAALGRGDTIVCRPGHASITELDLSRGALSLVCMGAEMQQDDVR